MKEIKDQSCSNCGKLSHFATQCLSRLQLKSTRNSHNQQHKYRHKWKNEQGIKKQMHTVNDSSRVDYSDKLLLTLETVHAVEDRYPSKVVTALRLGKTHTNLQIDTDVTRNVISRENLFENCESKKTNGSQISADGC
ncbi:hypothetical protein SNE40_019663 [Patella caerulea]|uniref:CCHC-type domain-containing protein n=1 Tax=Patella caerulea TaxID=87958 RepID=A0AAN8J6U6_PATCE